jgi:hypothetical protein
MKGNKKIARESGIDQFFHVNERKKNEIKKSFTGCYHRHSRFHDHVN